MESIFPGKVESVEDVPWEFTYVLNHALRILNWQENLVDDEVPPKWMWLFEDELEKWFKEVDRARKEKFGRGDDEEPEGGYMYNEEAERFRG